MNPSQIHSTFKSVLNFLSNGKINHSIQKVQLLIDELQVGEYTDRFNELEQNYRYLLYYFTNDIHDPERKIVYNKLISRFFILVSILREELFFRNSSGYEYTQKRYFPHRKRFSELQDLVDAFDYYYQQKNIISERGNDSFIDNEHLRKNYEQLLPELFSVYWLATTYNQNEKNIFNELITVKSWSYVEKSMLVSALTLNLWRMFDESKLLMLFDCCNSTEPHVKQRALVGVCFVLVRYNRFIPFFPSVRNRLVILADESKTLENFRNIFIQIISTSETDKITRKMQEEILPEVMKISPLIKDKLDNDNLLKSDEFDEENPEWQELIDKSGASEKLRELNELQMEGADVYMSTFSMLKSFPFFYEFTNWFMPFDPENSAVSDLFKSKDSGLLSAFIDNNLMCNSDKFSFCLSVLQMPEKQRNGMKQSFKAESEQIKEMAKDEALFQPEQVAKNISKHYIQDLFRFFKLNSQSKDFSDMFKSTMLMHKSFLFDILSSGSELKTEIAEYLFVKNHYAESGELFDELLLEDPTSVLLLQKNGYANQKLRFIDKALEMYLRADIIQPDDVWTVKKIALCYRIKGENTKALEYYKHADFLKPNQKNTLMNIAGCLEDMGDLKEALSIFMKINDEEDAKILRAIVRNSFMSNNLAGAEYYSERLLEMRSVGLDFILAGHIAFCRQKIKPAVEFYQQAFNEFDNADEFESAFNQDKAILVKYGLESGDIALMLDAVLN